MFIRILLPLFNKCCLPSVLVKIVTTGPKDPDYSLGQMLLRKRYRLRRKGRVDAANVVAQQTSMAVK